MTENLDGGNTQVDGGAPGQPIDSGKSQADSGLASEPQKVLESLEKRLGAMESVLKGFQRDRDGAGNKALKEVGDLRKTFGELQSLIKRGLSEDEAFDELESRKVDGEFREAVFQLRDALQGKGSLSALAGGAVDVASVVSEYGLSSEDPLVLAELQGKSFQTRTEVEAAIARVLKKKANQPTPSPLHSSSKPQEPKNEPNADQLREEYQKEMRAIPRGAVGNSARRAIQEKYKQKGVNIYDIDFG